MINFIIHLGILPEDSTEIRLKKSTTVIISLICCFIAPFWIWIYCSMGMYIPALAPALYLLMVVPAFVYYCSSKKEHLLVNIQLISNLLLPVFMQWTLGGVCSGNIVIVWSFMAPLSALLFHDIKKAKVLMFVLIFFFILTGILDAHIQKWSYKINDIGRLVLLVMNLSGPLTVVYFTMQFFVKTITKNRELLKKEKHKSDTLLLNILPTEVAEELKEKGSADAKHFNDVSVLFTDFKGFTTVAERLTPQQLVNELHNCFKAFDGIMGKYDIEKIKTVGDAYLAVSGLPLANPKHAQNIVSAAIEIRHFMAERKKELGNMTFEIRIGVHSGSVVAGIVGVKKFAYDIWGDTVNTAARMEQNSEAGKINISQNTYELVKDKFTCIYRGEIQAKNKGALGMYFVE